MNWYEQLAVTIVAGLLRGAIKNPKRFAGAEHIVVQVRDDAALLALAIDPNVPPPPGYRPA